MAKVQLRILHCDCLYTFFEIVIKDGWNESEYTFKVSLYPAVQSPTVWKSLGVWAVFYGAHRVPKKFIGWLHLVDLNKNYYIILKSTEYLICF